MPDSSVLRIADEEITVIPTILRDTRGSSRRGGRAEYRLAGAAFSLG
ncbi:MAG: hypothetical protein ACXVY9_10140 [Terriglobales bacterium]